MKKFKFKIDGSEYEVSINEIEQNIAEIEVNGTPFTVEIEKQDKASSMNRKAAGKVAAIKTPSRSVVANAIKAPLPGNVMKILVSNGQNVKRGDVLLTMESMKMENNILAEHDGIIRHIHVQQGQSVMQDDLLIDFEGTEAEIPVAQAPKTEVKETPRHESAPAAASSAYAKPMRSPLPGSILKVAVSAGQHVKRGDLLLTLESMKMENSIYAEKNGIVKKIHVQAGQSVMQDDVLLDIE
ncbi:MAG: biotin/lipoyl-binding protein [Paludibacter sp.]|jgi:biotin carboxyl carrier protein|nr:biotin/lipoyl-binding protein [Paludibacter sp.]